MRNSTLVLTILLIVFIVISLGWGYELRKSNTRVKNADLLADQVISFLDNNGNGCNTVGYPSKLNRALECMSFFNEEYERLALSEINYKNFNTFSEESGFVILENDGQFNLISGNFELYKNRQLVDKGCVIPGLIEPGYLCRLDFQTVCETGDVLEVKYEDTRAYIKTC